MREPAREPAALEPFESGARLIELPDRCAARVHLAGQADDLVERDARSGQAQVRRTAARDAHDARVIGRDPVRVLGQRTGGVHIAFGRCRVIHGVHAQRAGEIGAQREFGRREDDAADHPVVVRVEHAAGHRDRRLPEGEDMDRGVFADRVVAEGALHARARVARVEDIADQRARRGGVSARDPVSERDRGHARAPLSRSIARSIVAVVLQNAKRTNGAPRSGCS